MDPKKFSDLEAEVSKTKEALDCCLQNVLNQMPNVSAQLLNEAHLKGAKFFSKFESFISSISSESESLSKTQVKDVLTSIENVLDYSVDYWEVLTSTSDGIVSVPYSPELNFLKTSQLVLKTHNKEQAMKLKDRFIAHNIPTVGFDSKGSYKLTSTKIDWVSLVTGSVLLAISGLLVFFMDIDTGMKYFFSRILISLSVAFLFTGIAKEKIQAKINIPGLAITALGTIAIFFTLYFANPADMPTVNNFNTDGVNSLAYT
ncbi:hypothetical protein [Salinivibrio sp. ML290]|uniref:hypothetical protein n=1 Tax=Salinivibrio sp. ML290 TaxID=1909468 RepID=UPI0009883BA9|nr:hypothetical protein [Salinivibrio sp. ML290]OOE76350.1 hypothetical protein BZG23_02575 [Salinivibrio sp. ML290]